MLFGLTVRPRVIKIRGEAKLFTEDYCSVEAVEGTRQARKKKGRVQHGRAPFRLIISELFGY